MIFKPLPTPQGGHDMLVGPCSCGAWHDKKDTMNFKPRWYGGCFKTDSPTGVVQIDATLKDRHRQTAFELPEEVLRLAQREYDIQHPGQPYERMQERGGLSVLEIVYLMADHIERLKNK